MEILKVYQTKNPAYTGNRAITPVGILVHSTGASNPNCKRYVDAPDQLGVNKYGNHWNKATADKCVHAFIGYNKDKRVVVANTLPYDRACWGCGKGKKGSYNRDPVAHIQFEICESSATDSAYYWKAIEVAEEYCAHLCKQYGWTADKITSHVEAHNAGYASNHGDPHIWMKNFGDNMGKFRSRVAKRLNGDTPAVEQPAVKEPAKEPAKEETKTYAEYVVKSGDSLWMIAKKQLGRGNRYNEIVSLNGLKSTVIRPGQKLKLPKK